MTTIVVMNIGTVNYYSRHGQLRAISALYLAAQNIVVTVDFTLLRMSVSVSVNRRAQCTCKRIRVVRTIVRDIQILQADSSQNNVCLSVEPVRTTAYSPDIGWRVIWQRLGMDSTFEQIGKRLQIAPSTAHHIFSRFRDTGSVAPLKLVSSPDQIFRARPADSSKNSVWILSL